MVDIGSKIVPSSAPGVFSKAGDVLLRHGIVVVGTETSYGISVQPRDRIALERIKALKSRGASSFPLIACSREKVLEHFVVPKELEALIDKFWPGPLTLALQPKEPWPQAVLARSGTIGVRAASSDCALKLSEAAGGFITATSANLAGEEAATTVCALSPKIVESVELVIDCGEVRGGLASTVVEWVDRGLVIHRMGAIAAGDIAKYCPLAGD